MAIPEGFTQAGLPLTANKQADLWHRRLGTLKCAKYEEIERNNLQG